MLPLIEFKPAEGISHNRVIELINSEKKSTKNKKGGKQNDGWNQSLTSNQQVLSMGTDNNLSNYLFILGYAGLKSIIQ